MAVINPACCKLWIKDNSRIKTGHYTLTETQSLIDRTASVSPQKQILDEVISSLTSKFSELWNRVSDVPCLIGRTYSLQQQRENELRSQGLLFDEYPQSIPENNVQKHVVRLRDYVRDLVLDSIDQGKREQIEEMLIAFSDAGDEFVCRTGEFDENLRFEGVFQSLRNLWIINSMQMAFGIPIRVNPSGFAYSLLYTYSDNYLDMGSIGQREKEEFGNIFGLRLAGCAAPEDSPMVSKVSSLVKLIETEYPRVLFPGVYLSLLAIHRAQLASLQQRLSDQHGVGPDILGVSVEKGGTSVVADAYLAKGRLTPAETEFAFGYGVFLQFIDDLQDVKEDLLGRNETLFTRAATEGLLDTITSRLIRYFQEVLSSPDPLHGPRADGLAELILQGSIGLIIESIALNPDMFSEQFARTAELFSPVRFEAIRRFHERRASFELNLASSRESCAAHVAYGNCKQA